MSKELVKKESTELMTAEQQSGFESSLVSEQNITSSEIVIPKIIPMQGQSPLVLAGEAKFGELRDTLNNEILACTEIGKNPALPMEFVPFKWEKYWITKTQDGAKWKFEKMEKLEWVAQLS